MADDVLLDQNKYSSRKFILAVATLIGAFAMLWVGKIPADIFEKIIFADLAIYGTANVVQNISLNGTLFASK